MSALLIALVILVGAGTTVAASDTARPGDLLFSIDRAVEDVRLSLASKEKKNELRFRFAEERIVELEEIIKEVSGDGELAVAQVETNIETSIAAKTAADTADNTVTSTDDGVNAEDEAEQRQASRIEFGVETTLAFFEQLLADFEEDGNDAAVEALQSIILRLNDRLDSLTDAGRFEVRVRVQTESDDDPSDRERIEIRSKIKSDENRFEVRASDGRIRLELKDGNIRIREDSDDDDEGDNADDKGNSRGNDSEGSTEVEVNVFTNETIVKLELSDKKYIFVTDKTDKEDIIDEIVSRFDVTRGEVELVLNFEIEDRESRLGDKHDTSSRDNDSDDDDDDDDARIEVDSQGRVKVQF
ncbi:MAG TPA: DUF5667 domain-containing protein [Candidatus Paceibacterota bacterium]|jgi:hypothetical protein